MGLGSGLINGQSFGRALAMGGWYGLVGGFSGGVAGGLTGGISAVRDGRNFMHGGRLIEDVSMPIPQGYQEGLYDCNYEIAEQIDTYYGNNRDASFFQSLEPGKGMGLRDHEIARMYAKAGYNINEISVALKDPLSTLNNVANSLSDNKAVVLNFRTGINGGLTDTGKKIVFGHATAVNRVRIYNNGKFIINVMNPSHGGTTKFTSLNKIHRLFNVF